MQRWLGIVMVAVASLALFCKSADADPFKHIKKTDPRLTAAGIGVGLGMTGAYIGLRGGWNGDGTKYVSSGGAFALTTVGCMALTPIVSTIVVGRELTMREAHAMVADCVIPFLGSMIVNAAFDDHPEWEGKKKKKPRRRR